MALTLRSTFARTIGLGRKYTRICAANESFTIPAARIDSELLAAVRVGVNAGSLVVEDSEPSHGLYAARVVAARRHLRIILGVDHGSGVVLPNGSTLHKLTIGGVAFTLGNGNIDGANVTALLAAFTAALAASTDLADLGAAVIASAVMADNTALVLIDGTEVADWDTFVTDTTLTDETDAEISTPDLTFTTLTPSATDTVSTSSVPVKVAYTAVAGDVTRGWIALDTGITTVAATGWALRITRSGATVAHNGTVTLLNSRVVLVQNNSTTDFAAGDILTVFAEGDD